MKKTVIALIAVTSIGATALTTSSDANARWGYRGWGWGAGAFAAGAVLGGLAAAPYYGSPYGYSYGGYGAYGAYPYAAYSGYGGYPYSGYYYGYGGRWAAVVENDISIASGNDRESALLRLYAVPRRDHQLGDVVRPGR